MTPQGRNLVADRFIGSIICPVRSPVQFPLLRVEIPEKTILFLNNNLKDLIHVINRKNSGGET
jgi:hypothetical protein